PVELEREQEVERQGGEERDAAGVVRPSHIVGEREREREEVPLVQSAPLHTTTPLELGDLSTDRERERERGEKRSINTERGRERERVPSAPEKERQSEIASLKGEIESAIKGVEGERDRLAREEGSKSDASQRKLDLILQSVTLLASRVSALEHVREVSSPRLERERERERIAEAERQRIGDTLVQIGRERERQMGALGEREREMDVESPSMPPPDFSSSAASISMSQSMQSPSVSESPAYRERAYRPIRPRYRGERAGGEMGLSDSYAADGEYTINDSSIMRCSTQLESVLDDGAVPHATDNQDDYEGIESMDQSGTGPEPTQTYKYSLNSVLSPVPCAKSSPLAMYSIGPETESDQDSPRRRSQHHIPSAEVREREREREHSRASHSSYRDVSETSTPFTTGSSLTSLSPSPSVGGEGSVVRTTSSRETDGVRHVCVSINTLGQGERETDKERERETGQRGGFAGNTLFANRHLAEREREREPVVERDMGEGAMPPHVERDKEREPLYKSDLSAPSIPVARPSITRPSVSTQPSVSRDTIAAPSTTIVTAATAAPTVPTPTFPATPSLHIAVTSHLYVLLVLSYTEPQYRERGDIGVIGNITMLPRTESLGKALLKAPPSHLLDNMKVRINFEEQPLSVPVSLSALSLSATVAPSTPEGPSTPTLVDSGISGGTVVTLPPSTIAVVVQVPDHLRHRGRLDIDACYRDPVPAQEMDAYMDRLTGRQPPANPYVTLCAESVLLGDRFTPSNALSSAPSHPLVSTDRACIVSNGNTSVCLSATSALLSRSSALSRSSTSTRTGPASSPWFRVVSDRVLSPVSGASLSYVMKADILRPMSSRTTRQSGESDAVMVGVGVVRADLPDPSLASSLSPTPGDDLVHLHSWVARFVPRCAGSKDSASTPSTPSTSQSVVVSEYGRTRSEDTVVLPDVSRGQTISVGFDKVPGGQSGAGRLCIR
ncbi:hypothetical protein KIPB_008501, partial [Kipferlia bialata]